MDGMQQTLTVLSWNVNGFTQKKPEVFHHLSLLQADVVFLQETHLGPSANYPVGSIQIESLDNHFEWAVYSVFKRSCRGVAVLFRRSLGCEGLRVIGDEKGRYMVVSCSIQEKDFVFVNVYNAKDEKIDFSMFGDLLPAVSQSSYFVVGGDFNTVMDAQVDKTSNFKNRGHKDRFKGLKSFLESFNLVDVWRWLYPEEKSFTYFDGKGQSRLDYLFLPIKLLTSVTACKIHDRPQYVGKEGCISDHAPVSIQLQIMGRRCYFQSGILKNEDSVGQLSKIISNFSEMKKNRRGDLWPALKVRIYCEMWAFRNTLGHLGDVQTSQGASRNQSLEQKGLFWDSGHNPILHSPTSVSEASNLEEYLGYLSESKMFDDMEVTLNATLTEPVSKKEVLSAIFVLQDSEHFTPDGLPIMFYKHFATQLTDVLQAFFNQVLDLQRIKCVFNEFFTLGAYAAPSQRFENTDHTYSHNIQHHTSVFIFNVDYYILATILAERLKSLKRFVLNQVRIRSYPSVPDCIHDFKITGAERVLSVSVKVDPSAVRWSYLCQSLKTLHLPERFSSVVRSLVLTGGTSSSFCSSASQGLKVGCPLTPLLTSLSLFSLIHSMYHDDRLQGVRVRGDGIRSVFSKDTVIIFFSSPNEYLHLLVEVLRDLIEDSGFVIDSSIYYL